MAFNLGAMLPGSSGPQGSQAAFMQASMMNAQRNAAAPPPKGSLIAHDLFDRNQSQQMPGSLIPSPYKTQVNKSSGHANQKKYGETMIQNQARAFNLDADKLLSSDPKVHGPERQKLQQGLSDRAGIILEKNPVVQEARGHFDQAVSNFEANNNSVVISAGNDGKIKKKLEDMNHARSINTGPNFARNILENDEVTSVGATRWSQNDGQLKERRAEYSSQSDGVDVYASV